MKSARRTVPLLSSMLWRPFSKRIIATWRKTVAKTDSSFWQTKDRPPLDRQSAPPDLKYQHFGENEAVSQGPVECHCLVSLHRRLGPGAHMPKFMGHGGNVPHVDGIVDHDIRMHRRNAGWAKAPPRFPESTGA
jgi:hypothetical protein